MFPTLVFGSKVCFFLCFRARLISIIVYLILGSIYIVQSYAEDSSNILGKEEFDMSYRMAIDILESTRLRHDQVANRPKG